MRPHYLHESCDDEFDTIREVYDDLVYKPKWFDVENHDVKTVVDIGALIGAFSMWAHEQWPNAKIYAYEPDPESFKMFVKNIEFEKAENHINL